MYIAASGERESSRHRSKMFLHALARFAAYGIVEIPLTQFQNLHLGRDALNACVLCPYKVSPEGRNSDKSQLGMRAETLMRLFEYDEGATGDEPGNGCDPAARGDEMDRGFLLSQTWGSSMNEPGNHAKL
jgi:hypothetical protein